MEILSNEIEKEVKAIVEAVVDIEVETKVFEILESNCINIDFESLERRLTGDEIDFIESNY